MKYLIKDLLNPKKQLYFLLCGRDKFIKKTAHYCIGGYRKKHIQWGYKKMIK